MIQFRHCRPVSPAHQNVTSRRSQGTATFLAQSSRRDQQPSRSNQGGVSASLYLLPLRRALTVEVMSKRCVICTRATEVNRLCPLLPNKGITRNYSNWEVGCGSRLHRKFEHSASTKYTSKAFRNPNFCKTSFIFFLEIPNLCE